MRGTIGRMSKVTPQVPGPGQESVWDYPRPPRLEQSNRLITVRFQGVLVAETREAWRVLETSHPPTWYIPRDDVAANSLRPSEARSTHCEWKGAATYWDVNGHDAVSTGAAWSYETPTERFLPITGHLAFSPSRLECEVDGERATPQEGGFYEGWITSDVVGPFKGIPGSWGW
ncbi:hypothetical protein A2J03_21985 [Rhodococcus sp. EPR-157]|nr:hypothetical protein A2J03_21985 [Rhodococcus sp. EPR-157]